MSRERPPKDVFRQDVPKDIHPQTTPPAVAAVTFETAAICASAASETAAVRSASMREQRVDRTTEDDPTG
jgi:hypothetical protein